MGLLADRTKWVLLLPASGVPEDRHIIDVAFGLRCLQLAGVEMANISIYVDGPNRTHIQQLVDTGGGSPSIGVSAEFFDDLRSNDYESLVVFVTGHGGLLGIDADPIITPFKLLSALKSAPGLIRAVVCLGQCYAGIFNYIGAGSRVTRDSGPEVVVLGATNLHSSISYSTKEMMATGEVTWVANLFLLHLFKWITGPVDVDGDGKVTIMDAYKYAGAMSNESNKSVKAVYFTRSMKLHKKCEEAAAACLADNSIANQIALDAAKKLYEDELDLRYTHQESWVLNAIPAQRIEV